MFDWTEQTVSWYAAAVAYTGFDCRLADILTRYLPKNETICDLGCGIGYLALELATRGYRVTAIDQSAEAISWLRSERERRTLPTLEVLQTDWRTLADQPLWDNVVMVSAGRRAEKEMFYQRLCRKRLLVVDRLRLSSHVRADGGASARRQRLTETEEGRVLTFSLEFGQPLASLEDAKAYISTFGGAGVAESTLSTLVKTGNTDFPLYLPYRKDLELIVKPSLRLGQGETEEKVRCIR